MQPWDHLRPADLISENRSAFDQLIEISEQHLKKREYEQAAVYAHMAAYSAWAYHPGFFASSRLEKILLDIRATLGFQSRQSRKQSPVRNILHVMTEAYPTGGHTRLVANWIQSDVTHKHALAVTHQQQLPFPELLKETARKTNTNILLLDEKRGGLLRRAKRLRELATAFDLVVLHIHQHDVVPTLALALDEEIAPSIFLQHADIWFNVGTTLSDVVAHLRHESLDVSHERRGIDPARSFVLPIPLNLKPRKLSRSEAKAQLGIDKSHKVLLTVAASYKFSNPGSTTYAEALTSVLSKHPDTEVIIVGPAETLEWSEATEKTGGRLRAVGLVHDPTLYYEAADIYLNSFPLGSLTSLLEAGSYSVPLITYQCFTDNYPLLRCSDPALEGTMIVNTELIAFQESIANLLEQPEKRERLGERTQTAIEELHSGQGWLRKLEELYKFTASVGKLESAYPIENEREFTEEDKAVIWMNNSLLPANDYNSIFVRQWPVLKRIQKWNELGRPELRLLVPESIGTKSERFADRVWRTLKRPKG